MYTEAYSVIVDNATQEESYTYTICPDTTFDFDHLYNSTGAEQYVVPYLTNTSVICGDGDGDDECTFFGGDSYHIYFPPQFISLNVKFIGFTFTNNLYTSVAAFAHPLSFAIFQNCTWVDNNFDMFAIDLYYDPTDTWGRRHSRHRSLENDDEFLAILDSTSVPYYDDLLPYLEDYNKKKYPGHGRRALGYPSMLTWFNNSYFHDNYATSIINNEGGILDLQDTTFFNNRVFLAVVDVLFGGHLVMRNTTSFTSNTITFVPVFLDSTSMLQLNSADVYGNNQINIGSSTDNVGCLNGIFIEDENSYCLHGGKCLGECCDFGDESCDMYIPKNTTFHKESISNPSTDITKSSNQKSHGNVDFQAPTSVTVTNNKTKNINQSSYAAIISIVVILSVAVLGMIVLFVRRYTRKREVQLGNAPINEIA